MLKGSLEGIFSRGFGQPHRLGPAPRGFAHDQGFLRLFFQEAYRRLRKTTHSIRYFHRPSKKKKKKKKKKNRWTSPTSPVPATPPEGGASCDRPLRSRTHGAGPIRFAASPFSDFTHARRRILFAGAIRPDRMPSSVRFWQTIRYRAFFAPKKTLRKGLFGGNRPPNTVLLLAATYGPSGRHGFFANHPLQA